MDDLITGFQQLATGPSETVYHDAAVILESWGLQLPHLDISKVAVRPGEFASTRALYEQIVAVLAGSNCGMLELVPYIDDLLEYYELICDEF